MASFLDLEGDHSLTLSSLHGPSAPQPLVSENSSFQKITQPTLTQFTSPPHPRWWERQCVWETCCPSLSLLTFLQVPGALSSAGPKSLKFQRREPHSYSSLRRGWGGGGGAGESRRVQVPLPLPSAPPLHHPTPLQAHLHPIHPHLLSTLIPPTPIPTPANFLGNDLGISLPCLSGGDNVYLQK